MKAIEYERYGSSDVLKFNEVEKPLPGDNEVLIKIHAASLAFGDAALIKGKPIIARFWSGLLKPKYKIPGSDMAGCIEAIGKDVKKFKVGDDVYGDLSSSGFGAYAEYVCVDESVMALKPVNLNYQQEAVIPVSAVTALQGLRMGGQITAGCKVLINGASGGVGTFLVQLAKSYGAEVTAVCSTDKSETAQSIGADFVIDYTKEDFTQNGKSYDLIIGANGYRSLAEYKHALSPGGIYVQTGGSGRQIAQAMFLGGLFSLFGNKKFCSMGVAKVEKKDLQILKELIEVGKIDPVIDKTYPLSETAEAFRYFEKGHLKGKIVVSL